MALVTGGARRIGAAIVRRLHCAGWRVIIHYRASREDAERLANELNAQRPNSAATLQGDLLALDTVVNLVAQAVGLFGRLDALVNNASTFYPTAIEEINEQVWSDLIGSNLKAPLWLSQAAVPSLRARSGSIVNITDIHAERPLPGYVVYNIAKAGLAAMTRALAIDLAPDIRVNAVAPGSIEWPADGQIDPVSRVQLLSRIPLAREGGVGQIAEAVKYLLDDAQFVTGQTINVDGGRSVAL
ncbi:MAG: pteridine reductase [Burkholderiales bacterium]|nr:pteridine reductase [Burkholderiales bacterium]